jgi:hypothetical protein
VSIQDGPLSTDGSEAPLLPVVELPSVYDLSGTVSAYHGQQAQLQGTVALSTAIWAFLSVEQFFLAASYALSCLEFTKFAGLGGVALAGAFAVGHFSWRWVCARGRIPFRLRPESLDLVYRLGRVVTLPRKDPSLRIQVSDYRDSSVASVRAVPCKMTVGSAQFRVPPDAAAGPIEAARTRAGAVFCQRLKIGAADFVSLWDIRGTVPATAPSVSTPGSGTRH